MKLTRTHIWKLVGIVVLAGLIAAFLINDQFFDDATTGFDQAQPFNVYPEASIEQVADSLVASRILSKKSGFLLLASLSGWGDAIKAGHYEAKVGQSNLDLLMMLRRGWETPIHMVVPGGTYKERLIARMAKDMAFSEDDLINALSDVRLAAELGTDTTHLWAYMVPDTYFFYWLTSPEDVIRRLKNQADKVIAETINSAQGIPQNMTPDQVVRMAGIVEWESAHNPEKATIAGVYLNRLKNQWKLDADPTVQYAIMKIEGEKRRLFFSDYKMNHPYNTYKFRGLPPGPITNPSIPSIQGVLNPETHDYFFFVAKGDGQHLFSRTLNEHRQRARDYYRLMQRKRAEQEATKASE